MHKEVAYLYGIKNFNNVINHKFPKVKIPMENRHIGGLDQGME